MTNTESIPNKANINWPMRVVVIFLLVLLSTIISTSINDPYKVDAKIKTAISSKLNIEYLGNLQSIQTSAIGPLTFYKLNFFQQNDYQISATATQFFGFNPRITCVSSSKYDRCQ